jgi:hypothetical protein
VNRAIKIVIAVIIIGAFSLFAYKNIIDWRKDGIEKAIEQKQQVWQNKTNALKREIKDLQKELEEVKGTAHLQNKAAEAFGKETTETFRKETPVSLEEMEREVASFFRYLDNRDYIAAYDLKGGTFAEYRKAVDTLSKNPPIVSGEMDSLHRLLLNMAHLFRISGKLRIRLAKDILKNEMDIIEPVMRIFYLWFTANDKTKRKTTARPTMEVLYIYSGFFMDTVAGRSYLLRRDPKVRALTYYYCVLILDKANDEKLNMYGLDIRPHIEKSYKEIKSQIGLFDQNSYLSKLESLKKKYKISDSEAHR